MVQTKSGFVCVYASTTPVYLVFMPQLLLSTWLNLWKLTNSPASYAPVLILPFCVFPLCTRACLVRDVSYAAPPVLNSLPCKATSSNPLTSCQKCRWQVRAKHAYTLCMWLCMKWHGAWLYGVHRTCAETAAVSCSIRDASAVSTPIQWIFKNFYYEKLVTHAEPHVSAVSLLKRAENSTI